MSVTYDSLMAQAHSICKQAGVEFEAFRKGLEELGGTDADALLHVTPEDLQDLGLPKLKARQLAAAFSSQNDGTEREADAVRVTPDNAADVSARDLVLVYNPRQPRSAAAVEMAKRANGHAFIVFDEQGGVHRKLTTQLLEELERGDPARKHVEIGGKAVRIFKIGELPPETFDEHPLKQGHALHRDGTDGHGLNWRDGITLQVRQLLRLACTRTGELKVPDLDKLHDVHSRARGENAMEELRRRYPEASRCFDELESSGDLPRLKVVRNGAKHPGSGGPNDPFFGARGNVAY
jgi:hypothetical protein